MVDMIQIKTLCYGTNRECFRAHLLFFASQMQMIRAKEHELCWRCDRCIKRSDGCGKSPVKGNFYSEVDSFYSLYFKDNRKGSGSQK